MESQQRVQRLCSEIQLFDLCDLDYCSHKEGRFCTKPDVLEKFEAIKEEEEQQYLAEEYDEDEDSEELGYDESYDDDYDEDER